MMIGGMAALASPVRVRAAKRPSLAPRAIAMWDFSWLERRWPGGGYEDWDAALDALVDRGYDAVRVDAYPHLMLAGPEQERTLHRWGDLAWGSPGRVVVRIMPALTDFIAACSRRGVKVALSSWYRRDDAELRLCLGDPRRMAEAWIAVLAAVERAGLLDSILFVDLCNEFPGPDWAAFLSPRLDWGDWPDPRALAYIRVALDGVRVAYPRLPICFSSDRDEVADYRRADLPPIDLIEHHIWMAKENGKAFERATAARTPEGEWLDRVAFAAEPLYRTRRAEWDAALSRKIAALAQVSRATDLPLASTEGWAIVSLRDWPMLDWRWVKDVCAVGVHAAAASGRFLAICTSNFCGPQIAGMWRDVGWHRELTGVIKNAGIDADLMDSLLYQMLQ